MWVSNNKRLFTSKLSSVSAEIIAACSPGPAIGSTVFRVASSSPDDLSIKKACFACQIFGSLAKGVPLPFCGDSQLLWCLPCWMLVHYWTGFAGCFQTADLLLEHAKHTGLHNLYLDTVLSTPCGCGTGGHVRALGERQHLCLILEVSDCQSLTSAASKSSFLAASQWICTVQRQPYQPFSGLSWPWGPVALPGGSVYPRFQG